MFKTPITAIIGIQNVFARFESEGTRQGMLMVKLVYIATNLLALGLGIWKVNGMGLLPYVFELVVRSCRSVTNVLKSQYDKERLACLGVTKRATLYCETGHAWILSLNLMPFTKEFASCFSWYVRK